VGIRFSSHKHSGELVSLMAYDPGAEDIRGFLHHANIAKFMAKELLLGELDVSLSKIKITSDVKKGDINGDCTVDEIDTYLALNHLLGEFVDTEIEKKVDMNNNGVIDLGDVFILDRINCNYFISNLSLIKIFNINMLSWSKKKFISELYIDILNLI